MIKLTGEESWGSIPIDLRETYEVNEFHLSAKLSEDVDTCTKCALLGTEECFLFDCSFESKIYLVHNLQTDTNEPN